LPQAKKSRLGEATEQGVLGYWIVVIFITCLFVVVIQAVGCVVAWSLLQLPCQAGGTGRAFLQNVEKYGNSVIGCAKTAAPATAMIAP